MKLPTWITPRLSSGARGTDIFLAIATLITVVILYQCVLATYVQNFIALKHSLKSHQALLNNKTLRTQAIQELHHAKNEYTTLLEGLNGQFFNDVEADLFIKGLHSTMSTFGNRVILFKPKPEAIKHTRSEDLSAYIQMLNISTKEKLLAFIAEHRSDIDTNQEAQTRLTQMARMIPEKKRDEFKNIWTKTEEDPLSKAKVSKLELEVMIQGSYYELVNVLTYLKDMNKGLEIQQINVITTKDDQLETSFILAIYTGHPHE